MKNISHKLKSKNYSGGQAMLLATIFFLFISLTIIFGITVPVINHIKLVGISNNSKQSYVLAEAGVEDIVYRLKRGKTVPENMTITLNGVTSTVKVTTTGDRKKIIAVGDSNNAFRKIQSNVIYGSGIAFFYGIQAGNGGFSLANSSSITGNVFSSGSIVGSGGNYIYGDAVSASSSGLVYGIHATGTVFSHAIGKSGAAANIIDKDAYYQSITNTTVSGQSSANCSSNSHCHPNSPDQNEVRLPISDEQINQWEGDAAAGGTMNSGDCDSYIEASKTCTISRDLTLGPIKIPFNLILKGTTGGTTLTVAGPIWVVGNLSTNQKADIRMAAALGSQNVSVIADDPTDRLSGSTITTGQQSTFYGSGAPNSFVFMISQNNSAENGGSTVALSMGNSSNALVGYASHGLVLLSQTINLKEVTGYKISLINSANVTYDSGLPNVLFQSGPSGSYDILDWGEVE